MTGPEEPRCMVMRGGTSKGAYFLASDLPAEPAARDDLLLRVMGSPDPRQIDGIGGAHPLTSKVAVVSPSADPDADVDYLFLQVNVDEPVVSDRQNCGNILAGVGPFAVERGLVAVGEKETSVRIRMVNSGDRATATFSGSPAAGVDVVIEFPPGEGQLLPTGHLRDTVAGVEVTCVDNGMPTVLVPADALKVTGYEDPEELEADAELASRVRDIRLAAGELMGLGDVSDTTVPKVTLLAPPRHGGAVTTRTFIPVRCHTAIGVLGAASVAAGLRIEGSVADGIAQLPTEGDRLRIEHPTGSTDIESSITTGPDGLPAARRIAVVRTARKLFDGTVFPRPARTSGAPR
ncbi:PrpF domain-containing protein [Streptomyces endophyticus]|uniref:4-oxalomesaconate tautomerase n=1 Tax=Streptomyces endophyticus TaxID=714166 RepID=A0ABU6F428_9ACTN|nr:PrpF domain-containing protein [Streptomyces endophyticus]MEB8338417.1 4-oxalomesaconate tautomerase [Streptomyces endophyticus]